MYTRIGKDNINNDKKNKTRRIQCHKSFIAIKQSKIKPKCNNKQKLNHSFINAFIYHRAPSTKNKRQKTKQKQNKKQNQPMTTHAKNLMWCC